MASAERPGRDDYAAHNVVAVYRTSAEAQQAVDALGRAGVDAQHVELIDRQRVGSSRITTQADAAATGRVGKRAAIGAAIGAVGGVIVGLVIHLIVRGNVVPEIVGGLVGLVVGAALGAFYGGASALPRTDGFREIGTEHNAVAVHADQPELVDRAVAALAPTSPELLARFGADGELRRV